MDELGIGRSWSLSTDYILLTYLRSSIMSRKVVKLGSVRKENLVHFPQSLSRWWESD